MRIVRLEECVFLSIMRTCGLVRQKIINGKASIYVEKDKWNAFMSQYEVCGVEISFGEFSKRSIKKHASREYA